MDPAVLNAETDSLKLKMANAQPALVENLTRSMENVSSATLKLKTTLFTKLKPTHVSLNAKLHGLRHQTPLASFNVRTDGMLEETQQDLRSASDAILLTARNVTLMESALSASWTRIASLIVQRMGRRTCMTIRD